MTRVAHEYDADALLVAVPSADASLMSALDRAGRAAGLKVYTLPTASVPSGEVLGSRGSMLGTFIEQIEAGGPVTVTRPDISPRPRCRRSSPPPTSPGFERPTALRP